jgi:hypothetical protein
MKVEKFQLRGNNSVRAGAFQLLRGCTSTQLRGKIIPGYSKIFFLCHCVKTIPRN